MLDGLKKGSHLAVALAIAVVTVMAALGLIGERHHEEKIEQLQVVVTGSGENGLQITETFDYDFGSRTDRHGLERIIPNDFGVPLDVTASSPDAPDGIADQSSTFFDDGTDATRIRVGDPDVTVSGQHRYTLSYVLPAARFAGPDFSLDAIGTGWRVPIEDIEIVFSGISLDSPRCSIGSAGSDDPCDLASTDPITVRVDQLDPGEGVTLSGEVATWATGDPVAAPALPERRNPDRGLAAGAAAALATVTSGAIYLWARRSGTNEVVGASAAEAAHGVTGPAPGTTRDVTDAELSEMTTIEFAPPRGIEPWQGAVVLTEQLDQSTVTAWFSGAIADEVLAIELRDGRVRLSRGPKADEADGVTSEIIRKLFGNREVVDLHGYDAQFAKAWAKVEERQDEWVRSCGWWKAKPPKRNQPRGGGCLATIVLVAAVVGLGFAGFFLAGLLGPVGGIASLLVVAIGVPALVARVAYGPLLAGRTANGSAYALQVASFRRFLVESEGQYVDWAWKNGLLRQYSAWAVALDAADAWQHAMERAGVPQPEIQANASPLLVHAAAVAFTTSHVAPSTSSSGGSSGFSSGGGFSGSVGGGGGGGGGGSW